MVVADLGDALSPDPMNYSIAELASHLGLPHQGDGTVQIWKVSGWDDADNESLVFLQPGTSEDRLTATVSAACIIGTKSHIRPGWNAIVSESPKLDFARAARLLQPRVAGSGLQHPSATVSTEATIGRDVDLGSYVTVEAGAHVGRGSILRTGVVVGEECVLGEQCILHPNVVLYQGAEIGDRVELHAGVVIGSDGFGYVPEDSTQVKFPQIGRVRIEDDVEIGANTTVDRGSLGTTLIGAGTKIDNLVQIAHNVKIGRGVVIASQTGIAGSTVIEDSVIIGGQVGFGDHAHVEQGAIIGSKAGILPGKIVRGGGVYWGVPVRPLREFKRLNALFGRLPTMKKEIDVLRTAVTQLAKKVRGLQERKD